jgi:hypothetical protein
LKPITAYAADIGFHYASADISVKILKLAARDTMIFSRCCSASRRENISAISALYFRLNDFVSSPITLY